jgi:hypothetical protein
VKIKSQKDFFSGLMFTGVGAAFALGATSYTVGNGARMGPGYFPLMLGILLAILGARWSCSKPWSWKPMGETRLESLPGSRLFFVIASNLLFGILLGGLPSFKVPAMGLIAAIYGLTDRGQPGR